MRGMKLIGLSLLLAAGAASAQVTGTVTATSDYDFRGISQTSEDAALQGSLDWAHDSGIYAGIWGSNIDFGETCDADGDEFLDECDADIEVDVYAGYGGEVEEGGLRYDFGLVYYAYPSSDLVEDYSELYAGAGISVFDAKLWYSDDLYGLGESAYYIEASLTFELPEGFGLGLHAGYSDGDYFDGSDAIADYGVSITKSFDHFDGELKYVDTDLDGCNFDALSCDGRLILSVSTTFPWSNE